MKKKKSIVNGLRKALVQGRSTKIKNGQQVVEPVETDNGFMNDLLEDIPAKENNAGKTAVAQGSTPGYTKCPFVDPCIDYRNRTQRTLLLMEIQKHQKKDK